MPRLALVNPPGKFTAAGGPTTGSDHLPRRRYTKDILRVGRYRHPKEGWELDVTPEKLAGYAAAFGRMKANGVAVEVPVDHSFKADDNRGYVLDMWVEGDTLWGLHELIGPDAFALAERCPTTSPLIVPGFEDGQRRAYGEAIVHNSIVQGPVIPGQGPWHLLAASLHSAADVEVYYFSATPPEPDMDIKALLAEIKKVVGSTEEMTEANLVAKIQAKITEASTKAGEAEAKLADFQKQLDTLNAQLAEARKQAAGKAPPTPPDPDTLGMLAEGANAGIDSLVAQGAVTPAIAASLKKELVGDPGSYRFSALSSTYAGEPGKPALAKRIIDILKGNKPTVAGSTTGPQGGMAMSQAGREGEEKKMSAEEREKERTKDLSMAYPGRK